MTSRAEMRLLGKIFAHEVETALNGQPTTFQTRSKMIQHLRAQGLVREEVLHLGGRFPVEVRGWQLTALGHMTYCMSCKEAKEPQ